MFGITIKEYTCGCLISTKRYIREKNFLELSILVESLVRGVINHYNTQKKGSDDCTLCHKYERDTVGSTFIIYRTYSVIHNGRKRIFNEIKYIIFIK